MIITKMCLPRRTFLRGVGATLALPLLDAMVPALARASDVVAPAKRLAFIYVPNGMMDLHNEWTPVAEGAIQGDLPVILQPLTPYRDQLLVLSGLHHKEGMALPSEGSGEHARASATWLTGVHPNQSEGADIRTGISVDQLAARELGKKTQLASLELALDPSDILGACERGFSCAYDNTLSWRTATTPNPCEHQPRAVFEDLFGDSDSTHREVRLAQIRSHRSLLDFVTESLNGLVKRVGPSDQHKLNEYFEAIRDVERRIQLAEQQSSRELPTVDRPFGIPATYGEHAKLQFDLLALAYQCDLTRVATFMMGHELTNRAFPEIGITDSHHPLTHHSGDAEKIAKVTKIDIYTTQLFAQFMEKLRSTPDGDGSLLDHSITLYGAGLGDGNLHKHVDLRLLLAGGGSKHINGRHLRYPTETPMANLFMNLLEMVEVPAERIGEGEGQATGPLSM